MATVMSNANDTDDDNTDVNDYNNYTDDVRADDDVDIV